MKHTASPQLPAMPWWRVRLLWLVIGGPLLVVVASLLTLALALRHPDPVLAGEPAADAAHTPAMTARNHAAQPRR